VLPVPSQETGIEPGGAPTENIGQNSGVGGGGGGVDDTAGAAAAAAEGH
jgi:hypothetical protein